MITVRGTAIYDERGMLFVPDSLVASGAGSTEDAMSALIDSLEKDRRAVARVASR